MERRRSQRTAVLSKKSSVAKTDQNAPIGKQVAVKAGSKRKVSETASGLKLPKVLGDITNKKTGVLRSSSLKSSNKKGSTSSSQTENILSSQSRITESGSHHSDITNVRATSIPSTQSQLKVSTTNQLQKSSSNINQTQTSVTSSSQLQISSDSNSQSQLDTVPSSQSNASASVEISTSNPELSDSVLNIRLATTDETLEFHDIDKENMHDIFQSPEYAQDIFNYYKLKEAEFLVDDYMSRQSEVTPSMRAVLVDWLVEVQENFELNHETLYLAVRLVDHYLAKHDVSKELLQLVGAAAVFIGCKFDERIPPMVDDFLFICDDAYNRPEFVKMEKDILRTVDFSLGMPISYRFLRRFAKAGKKSMKVLTLARYINETTLMSYKIVHFKESLIAAGCLRLAMLMLEPEEQWTSTLHYYSGYSEPQLKEILITLNSIMHTKNPNLKTVETKYSHQVFFEVAKHQLVPMSQLQQETVSSSPTLSSTIADALRV